MNLSVVSAADVRRDRWRNGGGWTRELLAWPSVTDWTLRISVADIEAHGPFSVFSGVDRWFAVLGGEGVFLRGGMGQPVSLTPHDALYAFAGEVETTCELIGGPVRDFNVMLRRDCGPIAIRDAGARRSLAGNARVAGLFVANGAHLAVDGREPIDLPSITLVWIDNPDGERYALELTAGAERAWWFELSPRS